MNCNPIQMCLCALLALSVAASATKPAEKITTLTEADNGKAIQLEKDAKIVIRLAGNATTGYSWAVAKLEGGSVEQVGKVEYERDAGGRIGSGGTYVATFRASKAGKATIALEYKRSWEQGTPPARTFSVTAEVK